MSPVEARKRDNWIEIADPGPGVRVDGAALSDPALALAARIVTHEG
ncbi:MAG: hypothetical protein V1790_14375 [Planctomycetota bacterium]